MINDCKPQCIDQLELLAQLAAKVDYLYQFYRNLSLSDLIDVKDCLSPLKDQHLVFDGHLWDAENQSQVTLTVEPLLNSGVAIAKITFNGDTTTLYCKDGTRVEVTPKSISGSTMDIATITVDGVTKTIKSKDFTGDINIINQNIENINGNIQTILGDITDIYNIINNLHNTEVIVTPIKTSGEKIATISVDGVVKDLYAPTQQGPISDGIQNIKINNINGTVSNRIASLTLTGADINITGYTESEDVNDDLELAPTDTVNEAFGKLAKALKDDEAAVTRAFLQVEDSTGFNDNLEYVPEESTTLLGNAKNLQDADAILMNNLTPLIQFKAEVLDVNKIVFKGGTSDTVKIGQNALNPNNGYQIAIPYEGNCTNVTYRFPPATYASGAQYYTISTVISSLEQYLLPPLIFTGRVITFETAAKTWEWWQYVGPMSQEVISPADWSDMSNWKKLNISYA